MKIKLDTNSSGCHFSHFNLNIYSSGDVLFYASLVLPVGGDGGALKGVLTLRLEDTVPLLHIIRLSECSLIFTLQVPPPNCERL